jgi:DNA-binding PadR family transcriptional regulator
VAAAHAHLVILAAGEAHGYAIMREVERMTDGRMQLGPGTLYRSIDRMLVDELIEKASSSADERRNVYRISRRGLAVARAETRRLDALVRAARARGLLDGRSLSSRRGATT